MITRLYIPVYAFTLLLSAALLFSVQPMFSKMILPLLGGTPQVWNTAMLFFQLCLLGGYAYAHGTSRILNVRVQALVHVVLLAMFTVVLPIAIPEGWVPDSAQNPALWQLGVMALTVGGPFFVLAGSAPMLQHWFARTKHKDSGNPYFLYGASNLGSMSALLAYPVVFEPLFALGAQSQIWSYGYFALIAFTAFSALLVWNARTETQKGAVKAEPVNWAMRGRWLILAFIPSSLMLGVTTYITTDIASVPLLWVLPLALYVGTFILVFARKTLIPRGVTMKAFLLLLFILITQMICFKGVPFHPFLLIGLNFGLFFFAALMCHQDLADSRPAPARLTEFYLIMSIGGALGGFFNAILAPHYLVVPVEYVLTLIAACFMRYSLDSAQNLRGFGCSIIRAFRAKGLDAIFSGNMILLVGVVITASFAFGIPNQYWYYLATAVILSLLYFMAKKRWLFGAGAAFVLLLFPPGVYWGFHDYDGLIYQDRNFFGVIKVVDRESGERQLLHGTTNHGAQALDKKHRLTPLSYYGYSSPIRDAFASLDRTPGAQNVAIVGLGIGVTACFPKDARHFDFYEIDPAIVEIAENPDLFTYLRDCGSPYDIILGDGRLTIQNKPEDHYNLILLDAFSSDNVPVHLLTVEAIGLYLDKLKDDGILVFNISNNYLDLEPLMALAAAEIGVSGLAHLTNGGTVKGTDLEYYPAHFFTFSKSEKHLAFLKQEGWSEGIPRKGVRLWTDKYSNILSVIGNKTGRTRFEMLGEEEE